MYTLLSVPATTTSITFFHTWPNGFSIPRYLGTLTTLVPVDVPSALVLVCVYLIIPVPLPNDLVVPLGTKEYAVAPFTVTAPVVIPSPKPPWW